jgi:hypothetical protein
VDNWLFYVIVGKVNIFGAEDLGEKDASDFRDQYDERILSPGQSDKEK